jgi:hypothetical protein
MNIETIRWPFCERPLAGPLSSGDYAPASAFSNVTLIVFCLHVRNFGGKGIDLNRHSVAG